MREGGVDVADLKFVPEDVYPYISNYRIFRGDLFISVAGTLGIVGEIPHDLDGANLTENADRITDLKCDKRYLLYHLLSERIQREIGNVQTLGAQPKLALGRIEKFAVPFPPTLAEQKAIAAALSDVDELLGALDRLIAKKRDLKQAAMQDLLTGKRRLPGFSGAWETRRLGEVGSFLKGSGIKRDQLVQNGIPCVRYGELYTIHHDIVRHFESFIPRALCPTATRLMKGDLLFAGSGETAEEIGKCAAIVEEGEIYAGGDIVILRQQADNPAFLGYLMNLPYVIEQKKSLGQGDAVVHISARALATVSLELPEVAEQTAIAAVLSDMDEEIAALEARREKTRLLKQGMMQELLTGRIRLIDPEDEG